MNKVFSENNALVKLLKQPALMKEISAKQWNECIKEAKMCGLGGRLAADAAALGIVDDLPLKVQNIFRSFSYDSTSSTRKIVWEMNRVARAFHGRNEKVVLLKGAAYIAKGLRCAEGRMSVDLDILVPKNRLDFAEEVFLSAGWEHQVVNDYDQKFYREYSHELPPLIHPGRQISIDVHHSILPLTGRVLPSSKLLLENAIRIDDNYHVFSDVDILLHSVVHLFQDGEIRGGIRNLLEQHDLYSEFGENKEFWDDLVPRAVELGMTRSLYYSLKFSQMIFDTKIPTAVFDEIKPYKANFIYDFLMTIMVPGVISPSLGFQGSARWLSQNALYIRSHWLRMPPWLLTKHLTKKFIMGFKKESGSF